MSEKFRYESDRGFILVGYRASHGLLLLTSSPAPKSPTRIDILFQDVRALEMRVWFDGLLIQEVDDSDLETRASKPVELMEVGNRAYMISGRGWEGYIMGGRVAVNEDERERSAPSALTDAFVLGE